MKKTKANSGDFSLLGFLWRLLLASVVVFSTFNPSGYSAYHWIIDAIRGGEFGPLHAIAIMVLLIGWAIVCVATWRSLETLGLILAALALAAFVWLFVDIGLLKPNSVSGYTWVVLTCLAIVLAVGMFWSHLWRRLTGQYNVDDVDE